MRRKGLFVALILVVVASIASAQSQAPSTTQREDAEQLTILQEGENLLRSRRPQEAMSNHFARVIAYYESKYRDEDRQIYCTRSMVETLRLLAKHRAENPKKGAIAVSSLWCEAYYLKAYAFIELGRLEDAKSALEYAVSRSPLNSQYLSELAFVYLREKNWNKSLETYQAAEKVSDTSPEQLKNQDLSTARRGVGYVLIELNRLEEAEAKYMQCLDMDPNDSLSRNQLEYIRSLRASKRTQ
jgi:Flp pilus assembly protein TadD